MDKYLYVDAADEISDLVETVKTAATTHVRLVVPEHARSFQTPLNVRLLAQFAKTSGKKVTIISADARIQEMARAGGFTAFASTKEAEGGVVTQTVAAAAKARPQFAFAATEADGEANGNGAKAAAESATAVAVPPAAKTASELSSAWLEPPAPPAGGMPPRRRTGTGTHDRRPLYFAGVAVAVIGVLLFLFVAPSATVDVTIAATPLSVNPVIQGSTDAAAAKQGDHILTQVVNDKESGQFKANPTGTKQLPALASSGSVTIEINVPMTSFSFPLPQGTLFTTDKDAVEFVSTQDVCITFADNQNQEFITGTVATDPNGNCGGGSALSGVPIQGRTAGTATNVAAKAITQWPDNPCDKPQDYSSWNIHCNGPGSDHPDIKVFNSAATTGGADAKNVTVASQDDVNSFNTQMQQLTQQLTDKVNAAMVTKTQGKTIAKDPSGGGEQVQCTPSPALPNVGDQFSATNVTLTCQGTAALYNLDDVKAALLSDLNAQVSQGDELVADQIQYSKPQVTQAAVDGTVILSVKATGFSRPAVDFNTVKPKLAGKSASDASRVLEGVLGGPVLSLVINERPLPLPVLPFFSSRITLNVHYQAQTPSSS